MSTRFILLASVILAALASATIAPWVEAADPGLARLLQFMAVLKGVMALAAMALVWWRFGRPAGTRVTGAAIGAVAAMASGSVLIWKLDIVAGAVLFHAGLATFLGVAWADGRQRLPQRLVTGTATSFLRRNGSVQGGS